MRERVLISAERMEDVKSGYILPVRCYFKSLGLQAGDRWSPADYMLWVSKRQKEFFVQAGPGVSSVPAEAFYQWLEAQVSGPGCASAET